MSGDVQPRKRKDKKRKKDELGVEEPRGTAAALGEGDVFMHSQHDHGTGGHWCAKIIFFSLLAILVTLIGLIILENRGLSELEANSVESRYSGVLEGWLEDAPDDDHHDEHTLELNHHDDDDDGHNEHISDGDHNGDEDDEHDAHDEQEHSDEDDDHDDEDDDQLDEDDDHLDEEDEDQSNDDEDNTQSNEDDDNDEDADDEADQLDDADSQEQDLENNEGDDEEANQDISEEDDDEKGYQLDENDENDDDLQDSYENGDDDDENQDNGHDRNESDENVKENSNEENEEDEEHEEEDEDDEEVEVEKLEKETPEDDLEPVSTELPALPEEEDDDDNEEAQSDEKEPEEEEEDDSGIEDEGDEFLDDSDEPPIEKITVPAGKPFAEVEEEVSSEQPPDTLEEEEEYEKQQEELRKEEAQASHMWLKLGVGAALLVATHAVVRRATHSRDTPEREEVPSREETPLVDRRLTLIPEETPVLARKVQEIARPVAEKQVLEKVAPVLKSIPIHKQESEEEEEEPHPSEDEEEEVVVTKPADDKELYSDEELEEEVEEDDEEEVVPVKKEIPKPAPVAIKKPEPEPEPEPEDDEDPEDVEIIGDEQLDEELEEEVDEEEISDVDDAELLSRLEAKYGKLPEPERPGPKQKDGGNSIEDGWPGEPSDAFWRQQLDSAERELRQGSWSAAAARAGVEALRRSARALYVVARSLDSLAEARRDNRLLSQAIAAYLSLLKMNEHLSDKKLLEIADRALDRIQFRGSYLNAEPIYRMLIRRFPNEPGHRNNLTISFLMANRVDLAEEVLKETLKRWPKERVALAHHGFVLKTKHNKYEEAVEAFKKALEGDTGPANEARFYYHYGDSLLLLGRKEEAHEVHKRGAKLGHFLSPSQRSLYNVDRLKSSPWWNIEQTPYLRIAKALEKSWKEILKEGEAARALYELEREGLKERGEWSQLDLFVRGREVPERCQRAPVTCSVVRSEPAAAGCRRGQVKFSLMEPGTHVRAHVGPTNCRLRMHLGLSNTKDTYIRVDKEIRQWEVGKVLMFDDSFEHEVWHNGTGARLVLIVDVWHPQLTAQERRQLPAI